MNRTTRLSLIAVMLLSTLALAIISYQMMHPSAPIELPPLPPIAYKPPPSLPRYPCFDPRSDMLLHECLVKTRKLIERDMARDYPID